MTNETTDKCPVCHSRNLYPNEKECGINKYNYCFDDTRAEICDHVEQARAEMAREMEPVMHFARFMAATWSEVDRFVYKHCGRAAAHYPVIQGTKNQMDIVKIGGQHTDKSQIRAGVEYLLSHGPTQEVT